MKRKSKFIELAPEIEITYQLGKDERGDYIICKKDGYKSHNENDVRFKYCYICRKAHHPEQNPAFTEKEKKDKLTGML